MNAVDFGIRLGQAMEGAGFSKLAFSRRLQERRDARAAKGEPRLRKVDRPALYSFLEGRDVPPLDTAFEMARLLGVRVGWLALGEEPMEPDLPDPLPPIWLVDGHRGPWRPPDVPTRLRARRIFQEAFLSRADGFQATERSVAVLFKELLGRRLARRRAHGERAASDPAYRASTAWGLYLKCFLDLKAVLPPDTAFSDPAFTREFLGRFRGWMEDEMV